MQRSRQEWVEHAKSLGQDLAKALGWSTVPKDVLSQCERERISACIRAKQAGNERDYQEALEDLKSHIQYLAEQGLIPTPSIGIVKSVQELSNLSRAIATIQASADDSQVQAFREQYLPEGVIHIEQIRDWLRDHQRDGAPILSLTVEIAGETAERFRSTQAGQQVLRGQPLEIPSDAIRVLSAGIVGTLTYKGKVYPVQHDGALYALLQVVQRFMQQYGWAEDSAIEFVLSGKVPEGLAIRYSVSYALNRPPVATLQIPLHTEPETVQTLYKTIRAYWNSRVRGITEEAVNIVRFVLANRAEKWSVIEQKWKATYPNSHTRFLRRRYYRIVEGLFRLFGLPRNTSNKP